MRVSVTSLDQLLWWHRIEDMTTEELVRRLRKEEPPNRAMQLGTAFHSILEHPPSDSLDMVEQDGFIFSFEVDAEIELPPMSELLAEATYDVDGIPVTLRGKCDGLHGNVVTDHKLTAKPDPATYFSSYQWRAYLDIFEADTFEYVLYHAKDEGDTVRILNVETFRLYRYPGMRGDLLLGIREYVDFVREHMPEVLEDDAIPGLDDLDTA